MKYDRSFRLHGGPHRVTSDSLSFRSRAPRRRPSPARRMGSKTGWPCSCCSLTSGARPAARSSGPACPCRRRPARSGAACPPAPPRRSRSRSRCTTRYQARARAQPGRAQRRRGRRSRRRCAPDRAERAAAERARQRQRGGAQDQPRSVRLSAAGRRFRASSARSTSSTRGCSCGSRCWTCAPSTPNGRRATGWRRPASATAARAISSCSSPPTCISRRWRPARASRPPGRSSRRRARSTRRRSTCEAPAPSRASRCCARRCALSLEQQRTTAAAEHLREGEAAAGADDRPAAAAGVHAHRDAAVDSRCRS